MKDDEVISEQDDAELVQATLKGEEEAYAELARRYRKLAFGIALGRLGDCDSALDAAQEALVTAYMQLPVLRDPGRFASWLCRIANNLALIRLRRDRHTISLDSPGLADLQTPKPGPAEAAERSEKRDRIREALSHLSETDQLAVTLHYVSGYSHEEIADMLGVSASSVKTRLYRARRRLREEMLDAMETMEGQLPDVEVTEELLERILVKYDAGEYGVVAHLGGIPGALPGVPQYTEKTREAVRKIAGRLRREGCWRLYAPPHIPDGSPALAIFRSLGFETETEMLWYERDLTTELPSVPPLPEGFDVRRLTDTDPKDVLALLRATSQKYAPDAINEQDIRRHIRDSHTIQEASLAAYRENRLTAISVVAGVTSWENWRYEPGSGVLWWTEWDQDAADPSVITHLVAVSLKALKKRRLKRAVKDGLRPDDKALMAVLEGLGFRYIRSQWNLRLPL